MKTTATDMIECPKCAGAGRFGAFAHIESGTCFKCGGAGKIATPRARKSKPTTVKPLSLDTVRFRLSVMEHLPMEHGERWFDTRGIPGVGQEVVDHYASLLPPEEGAAVLSKFAMIRVAARRADRARANRDAARDRHYWNKYE